jgi:hypothetical protein
MHWANDAVGLDCGAERRTVLQAGRETLFGITR